MGLVLMGLVLMGLVLMGLVLMGLILTANLNGWTKLLTLFPKLNLTADLTLSET